MKKEPTLNKIKLKPLFIQMYAYCLILKLTTIRQTKYIQFQNE